MIFTPTTYEEVQACFQQNDPLVIRGSGGEDSIHNVLSLEHLNNTLLYEPEEMIVKVQAGMTIGMLSQLLGSQGQWIPTLVATENLESTVGAAIANDNYQPRANALGALRTTILGGTYAAADGTIFKSGSRVVKSVAGYDIHRAFCGSRGKLGAILDVTLKVQPLPERFYWFQAGLDHQEIAQLYPTITEENGTTVFYELAGYVEDIAHDRETLSNLNVIPMSEAEAHEYIRGIIRRRSIAVTQIPDAQFDAVRKVFDPKGILR